MKLLTKAIEKTLPKIYETENVNSSEKILRVKFFHPYSQMTWYGVEYDPMNKIFFGYVANGQMGEWGDFSLNDLEEAVVCGLHIERDMYFEPRKFGMGEGL